MNNGKTLFGTTVISLALVLSVFFMIGQAAASDIHLKSGSMLQFQCPKVFYEYSPSTEMKEGDVKTIGCMNESTKKGSCGPPSTTDVCLTKSGLFNAVHTFYCNLDSDKTPPHKAMTERDFFTVHCG